MENKEIIEGNRLIAEFLGWSFEKEGDNPSSIGDYYLVKFQGRDMWRGNNKDIINVLVDGHRFHAAWEKLMPVVEKISRIEFERKYDEDQEKWIIWTHHPVTFGMLDDQGRPMVRFYCNTFHFGDTLIEAAWKAVVDFIQWHQQTPSITQYI